MKIAWSIFSRFIPYICFLLTLPAPAATATQFDSLQVSGPAALAGQLDLSIINNYQPAQINSIPIITATQVSGRFAVDNGGTVGSGQALRPQYTLASVLLQLQSDTNSAANLSFALPALQPNGDIRLTLNGTANATFSLQTSSNLVDWADLITVTNPGPNFIYTLTGPRTLPARSFRARQ
jgi:hypothetical protein